MMDFGSGTLLLMRSGNQKKHLELMGYDESIEPSFQAWEDHIHSDDKGRVINAVNDSIKNKTDFFVEYLGLNC